jgi:hypothetical protein
MSRGVGESIILRRQEVNKCKKFRYRRGCAYEMCKLYKDKHTFAAVTLAARIRHGPYTTENMTVRVTHNDRCKNSSKAGNCHLSW